ncbi:MAG: hypothetical protein P1R58_05195 [bacterium]|nr:hypothetical protein [bacterium]
MSYTSTDNVKKYLADSFPRLNRIRNQPFLLTGSDYLSFFGGAVEESDLVVKSLQTTDLTRATVTFSVDRVSLSSLPLVEGSVVVASDSSLGRIYQSNVDYIIDVSSGDIVRKSTGALSTGQQVTVWYASYFVYTLTTDYSVDYDAGEIRRSPAGAIASDETVLLDYTPVLKAYNDEVINAAVLLANGLVQNEVDPDGSFGANPALETAATFKALAIVCQTSAVRDLSQSGGKNRVASDWMQLADSFDRKAADMLSRFRPAFENPKPPIHG